MLATLLVIGCRAWLDYHPLNEFQVLLTAWMIIVPLGFLIGIGGFDYWFYWASGRPTRPEDHSGHGALLEDYFQVNTDHKVIGVQYLVTTIFFFVAAGPWRCSCAPSSRNPGCSSWTTTRSTGSSRCTRRS